MKESKYLQQAVRLLIILATILTVNIPSGKADWIFNADYPNLKFRLLYSEHFSEFDESYNSNHNWWCGQTALSSALSVFNFSPSPKEIHDKMLANKKIRSLGYREDNCGNPRGHYCAYPKHLAIATEVLTNGTLTAERKEITSVTSFKNIVKKAIDQGNVLIVSSRSYYDYNYSSWVKIGHFYTIIGYIETKFPENFYILVRDPIYTEQSEKKTCFISFNQVDSFNQVNFWEQLHILYLISEIEKGIGYDGCFSIDEAWSHGWIKNGKSYKYIPIIEIKEKW